MTKSCPSWKSREQSPTPTKKLEICLSHLLIIRDVKIYLYTYVLEDDKKDEMFLKKLRITTVVKIQDGRQLWSKICSWYKIN